MQYVMLLPYNTKLITINNYKLTVGDIILVIKLQTDP